MKKLLLLLSVAVLSACGGSSGGGGTNAVNSNGIPQQTGTLKVMIAGDTAGKTLPMLNYTARSPNLKYRLVVTNPSLKINGVSYSNFNNGGPDIVVGQSIPNFTLPAADGYTLEIVKYVTNNGVNKILSYGKSSAFNISENAENAVNISLNAVNVTVKFQGYTTATPVKWDNYSTANASSSLKSYKYGVVTFDRYTAVYGLNNTWNMTTKTSTNRNSSPFATYGGLGGPRAAVFFGQRTPESGVETNLFAQAEFYLKPSLLKSTESRTLFSYVYPDQSTFARNPKDSDVRIRLKVKFGNMSAAGF